MSGSKKYICQWNVEFYHKLMSIYIKLDIAHQITTSVETSDIVDVQIFTLSFLDSF